MQTRSKAGTLQNRVHPILLLVYLGSTVTTQALRDS